jgi:hypothetical protein
VEPGELRRQERRSSAGGHAAKALPGPGTAARCAGCKPCILPIRSRVFDFAFPHSLFAFRIHPCAMRPASGLPLSNDAFRPDSPHCRLRRSPPSVTAYERRAAPRPSTQADLASDARLLWAPGRSSGSGGYLRAIDGPRASAGGLRPSDLCCLSGRETEVAGHSDQGLPDDCLDLVGAEAEGRGHSDRQVAELSLPGAAEDRQVD